MPHHHAIACTVLFALPAAAHAQAVDMQLWRMDCGTIAVRDMDIFSDTRAFVGNAGTLTASCYLIRHGADYMIWDAGVPVAYKIPRNGEADPIAPSLTVTIADQLAQIDLTPADIGKIGISHFHFDHVGQANFFPDAELIISAADWEVMIADPLPTYAEGYVNANLVDPWRQGGRLTTTYGDTDIYGDGTVVMLHMPGHTPGSSALLVTLPNAGAVLLSGDVAHLHYNLDTNGVPTMNHDRADSLASMDRLRDLGENLDAIVILQHDPNDIAKLPNFPDAAD